MRRYALDRFFALCARMIERIRMVIPFDLDVKRRTRSILWLQIWNKRSMTLTYRLVNFSFKRFMRVACRVDDSQWHKFPEHGPLIMAVNHLLN